MENEWKSKFKLIDNLKLPRKCEYIDNEYSSMFDGIRNELSPLIYALLNFYEFRSMACIRKLPDSHLPIVDL